MSAVSAPHSPSPPRASAGWRGFAVWFSAVAAVAGLATIGFVALLDPYGLRAAPGRPAAPLMDANQRFLYPQIARGGAYDAAVFGTSTARLIDPQALDRAFGLRFANLAINAATPFEQTAMARLFLRESVRHGTPARGALFALDATWCEPDAASRRLGPRPFPVWLYDQGAPMDLLRQVNAQSVAIAARVLLHRLGRLPERIRGDGYAVFTPPEAQYDPVRASAHIHEGGSPLEDEAPASGARSGAHGAPMPALDWLDRLLAEMPAGSLRLVAFMPVHVTVQGTKGTERGEREAVCKARVAAIGRARGATVVDFRIPSPITTRDDNYWDALHYRLPIAARIVAGLAAVHAGGGDDPAGAYRVLAGP